MVAMFYSNLTFDYDVFYSRVGDYNVNAPLNVFACVLHLSCDGVYIYDFDLEDFKYPDNEFPYTTSHLLHNNDNPALVGNDSHGSSSF